MDDSRYRHSWGCFNLARCLNLSRVVKEGADQTSGVRGGVRGSHHLVALSQPRGSIHMRGRSRPELVEGHLVWDALCMSKEVRMTLCWVGEQHYKLESFGKSPVH